MTELPSLDIELQSALTAAFGERYQLSEKLGTGAYGVVFRAHDTMLDRQVAIKQVRLDRFQTPEQAEEVKLRTQREAKMAAKLRHSGIVAVHDIVHTDKSTLIIMEYVNGETLEAKLRRHRRLRLEDVLGIIEQTRVDTGRELLPDSRGLERRHPGHHQETVLRAGKEVSSGSQPFER
jgi:predicted Ser/Thr protein kinase